MDNRRDAGEFYPGGKVVTTRPVPIGGDVKHSDFKDVEVETNSVAGLRAAVRDLATMLGATVVSAVALAFFCWAALGASVETAKLNDLDLDGDPSVVVGVSLEGLATTGDVARVVTDAAQNLEGATNAVTGTLKADIAAAAVAATNYAADVSDSTAKYFANQANRSAKAYADGLAEAVAHAATNYTDLAVGSHAPGDYANVSNRAMNALLATGGTMTGNLLVPYILPTDGSTSPQWYGNSTAIYAENEYAIQKTDGTRAAWIDDLDWLAASVEDAAQSATNYTDAAVATMPQTVTNIVRDLSLGGIWDESLQVWWTPRMNGGNLTYHATTNVNLNAEN